MAAFTPLESRGTVEVSGPDRIDFLQGLTSNDVAQADAERVIFSALLTPQGKYLHDFLIFERDATLILDCEAERATDLIRRLRPYRLRSQVTLADGNDTWSCYAVFGTGAAEAFDLSTEPGAARPFGGGVASVDPRHAALGVRLILPRQAGDEALCAIGLGRADADAYDRHRLDLGIPDGSRDIAIEKATLLEANYDALNAISWTKGCYMGQELTARTRYRGLLKRRLFPVAVTGPLPEPGTPVLAGDREVGEIRSGHGGRAIALLRIDAVESEGAAALTSGAATIVPERG